MAEADLTGAAGACQRGRADRRRRRAGAEARTGSAKGPFEVGPLEIAGAARRRGRADRHVSPTRAPTWRPTSPSIDLPQLPLTDAHVDPELPEGAGRHQRRLHASPPPAPTARRRRRPGSASSATASTSPASTSTAGGAHAAGLGGAAARRAVVGGPGGQRRPWRLPDARRGVRPPDHRRRRAGGARASLKLSGDRRAAPRVGGLSDADKGASRADGPLAAMPYRRQASGFTPHGSWRADGIGRARRRGAGLRRHLRGQRAAAQRRLQDPAAGGAEAGPTRAVADRCWPTSAAAGPTIDVRQARRQRCRPRPTLTDVGLGLLDQDFTGRFDADLSLQGQGQHLGGAMEAKLAGAGERGAAGRADPRRRGEGRARRRRDDRRRPARQRPGALQPRAPGAAGRGQRRAVPHRPGAHGADARRLLGRRRDQAAVGPADGRRAQPGRRRSTPPGRSPAPSPIRRPAAQASISGGAVHRRRDRTEAAPTSAWPPQLDQTAIDVSQFTGQDGVGRIGDRAGPDQPGARRASAASGSTSTASA